MGDSRISEIARAPFESGASIVPANSVESYKASIGGDGLRILEQLPQIIERGRDALTPAEKELLKWLGVFYRRPTPGKFMMRIRMPNGFARAQQLRAIAELSRRLGNGVADITTRQQIELGGFTVASPLNVFVEVFQAMPVVVELIKIYRDHGPREARSKCRFAFLIEEWGLSRLRAELIERLGHELAFQGRDMRSPAHADHLGVTRQKQEGLRAVGLCIPTGRVNPDHLDELARLAEIYGNGEIRLTTAQNAIIPNVPADSVGGLLAEPLLKEFSPPPSP